MGWDFIQTMVLSLDALLHPLRFFRLYDFDSGQTDRLLVPCFPGPALASVIGKMHRSIFECIPSYYSSYWRQIGFESNAGVSWSEIDGKLLFHARQLS